MQVDEKEKLEKELQKELQWVQYRQKMLDIMDEKLMQMKQLAEQAKQGVDCQVKLVLCQI